MYVKASNPEGGGDFLIETVGPVRFGSFRAEATSLDDVLDEFAAEAGFDDWVEGYFEGIGEDAPNPGERNIYYAYWDSDTDEGKAVLVTTYRVYILNNEGNTIDRVR